MAQFPRPQGTIENFADLKLGDVVFHVYGIWPPQNVWQTTITRAPLPFRDHPAYSALHISQAKEVVYDEQPENWETSIMSFASDGNLIPRHSHNDNYLFRSAEEATRAVAFLTEAWQSSGRIPAEIARREEEDRRMALYDNYYGND